MTPRLFDPLDLGAVRTRNRVFMAPLTRMRAGQPGDVPTDLMREHYAQRASAGLLISEATQISAEGKGYADTPGIHTAEQVSGWRTVTDAVHAAGGLIACQLWHTGRVNHESLHGGELPVSASAVELRVRTTLKDADGLTHRVDSPTPRALATEELPRVVADYRRAARNAIDAGFDLVEVHGAHGYLLHQFLATPSNDRTDDYGGPVENRARLLLEVIDAVAAEVGAARTAVRLSPLGQFNGLDPADDGESALYVAGQLAARGLAFLHLSEPDWTGAAPIDDAFRERLRAAYPGVIVGAGGYDVAKADRLLEAGFIDAAAFGRPFLANPDLPRRLAEGLPLNQPDKSTFYGGGARGYTDYPTYGD